MGTSTFVGVVSSCLFVGANAPDSYSIRRIIMRRLLFMFLFAIMLSFGVPKARGYTLVQKQSATGNTSIAVPFANANTAGNLIIVSAAWVNGGTASVSDSK